MAFDKGGKTPNIRRNNAENIKKIIKKLSVNIIVSFILVGRNFFRLIFYPYPTMRKIAQEKDWWQVVTIYGLVYGYFIFANIVRRKTIHPFIISSSSFVSFVFFLLTFFLTVGFFSLFGKQIKSLIFSFAYGLFPTLIWFFTTSFLYLLLPPPRTLSFLGKSFSLVFISFSLILLFWKIILFYLSLRFSLKLNFYKILYPTILFLVWFWPYSVVLYKLKVFRIPFI